MSHQDFVDLCVRLSVECPTVSMPDIQHIVTAAHRASSLVDDAELRAKLREGLDDVLYALLADCGDRPGHITRVLRIFAEHLGRGQR